MSPRLPQPTSQLQLSLVASPWYRHRQNVEVYTAIELYFHQYPLLGSLQGLWPCLMWQKASLSLHAPFSLQFPLWLWLSLDQSSLLASHGATLGCPSWLLHAFESSTPWETLTCSQAWPPSRPQRLCADLQDCWLPARFYLDATCLFSTTTASSAPAAQHPLCQQTQTFVLVILDSW